MSTVRNATYDEGNFGTFGISCADCPLLPHTNALGEKPRDCASGIATNMQGPVVLGSCPHLVPDSWASDEGGLTIKCNHGDAK